MQEFSSIVSIPAPIQRRLQGKLHDDERVLWAAQPSAAEYQDNQRLIQIFGIVWLGISVLILILLFPKRMSFSGVLPPLLGYYAMWAIFLTIGLYLVTIPFWSGFFVARTLYLITDRRVILLGCWFRGNFMQTCEGKALRRIRVKQRKDGSGDVILRRFRAKDENGSSLEEIGFFKVPEVARIRELIDDLKKKHTS
jgi:hypothetical protein